MKATKVNAGLAERNGRLLLGIWRDSLHVTCGLTACTPGSAPGPTLGNEYGKTLPLTQVSQYQKGKTILDFTEARDSEWQCHQLGSMKVCTLFQTDNHTSTPSLCFFTGRMPFLPPNQQRQSTEGKNCVPSYLSQLFCVANQHGWRSLPSARTIRLLVQSI